MTSRDEGPSPIGWPASNRGKDIDLPIDASPAHITRVRDALEFLADKTVDDVGSEDVAR